MIRLLSNHSHNGQEFLAGTAPILFISLALKMPGIGLV